MSSASEQDLGNDKTPRSDAKTIRNELTVMRKDGNGRFVVIVAHLETTVTQRSNIDKTKATIHGHDANNTSHNTQLHTRSIFSCVWLKSYKAQVCSVVVNTVIFIFWHATFHAQSSLLDALSRTPPTRTPSLLFPSWRYTLRSAPWSTARPSCRTIAPYTRRAKTHPCCEIHSC